MQTLAQDVGGLKRVLSNVKTRGNIGEIQLSMLLEQLLAPEQYEANVKPRKVRTRWSNLPSSCRVKTNSPIVFTYPSMPSFRRICTNNYSMHTIQPTRNKSKQPGKPGNNHPEDGERYFRQIPGSASYDEFGIMFLPFEGIYAEVVRRSALLEDLQRHYRVVVTGPTTLAAILNSLQMGFRTLAIQKYSGEVWKILGAVKKEFESMGGMLEKAKKHLETANGQIDNVLGVRTRAIQRRLKDVDTLSAEDARKIIPEIGPLEEEEKE